MTYSWLDQMFEPCAVYEPVWEQGLIVDFERVYLNAAGQVLHLTLNGQQHVTSLLEQAPNVREQGLFARYVEVARTGVPWTGLSQSYSDDLRDIVLDLHVWRVPEGIAMTYRDVTDRERLTHELAASREQFRATVDNLPEAVSIFQAVREGDRVVDFVWTYVNDVGARETGIPASELVGRRVLDVFPAHRTSGLVELYADVVETGRPSDVITVWHEDTDELGAPRRRAIEVRSAKVGDGLVVVTHDVTAAQRAVEELAAMSAQVADGREHRSGAREAQPAG